MPIINVFNNLNDSSKDGDQFKDYEQHISAVDITGTTSGTPGTPTGFAHGLDYTPAGAIVLSGEVYVTSVDATNVNVASTVATQNFRVRVVK